MANHSLYSTQNAPNLSLLLTILTGALYWQALNLDLYEMVLLTNLFAQGLMGNVICRASALLPPGMNQCAGNINHMKKLSHKFESFHYLYFYLITIMMFEQDKLR